MLGNQKEHSLAQFCHLPCSHPGTSTTFLSPVGLDLVTTESIMTGFVSATGQWLHSSVEARHAGTTRRLAVVWGTVDGRGMAGRERERETQTERQTERERRCKTLGLVSVPSCPVAPWEKKQHKTQTGLSGLLPLCSLKRLLHLN